MNRLGAHISSRSRRCGTQDFVEINPFYVFSPCERRLFVLWISMWSGRPLRRVSAVVSFKNAYERYIEGTAWASCASHTDHLICRSAIHLITAIQLRPRWWYGLLRCAQLIDYREHPRRWKVKAMQLGSVAREEASQ